MCLNVDSVTQQWERRIKMASTRRIDQHVIEKIKTILESLEYGTVQISVHDSQVTQIEKVEKHRLPLVKKQQTTLREQ